MKRDLVRLSNTIYDLFIIGGGIYGAWVAWDATLRGLSVALVEKADFGSVTSANSLKIIHGGLRYLQHADIQRMRESVRERTTLMRIAPHLVHPLPVLIPTYGHGLRGREVFSLALRMNDLIGFDRNPLKDPQKHIPPGRGISKREVLELVPGIPSDGLTGGVVFYDAQVHNSERLLLSVLRSADKAGANLANYIEVTGLLMKDNIVVGAKVRDALTGNRFDIHAKAVVNACGPWVSRVMGFVNGQGAIRKTQLAKAMNVVTRPLFGQYAVGLYANNRYDDPDLIMDKGARLLFATPWRGQSLIGTAYYRFEGDPDDFKVTEQDIRNFLSEINQACPSVGLEREDVKLVHGGLLPASARAGENRDVRLARHYQIYDHCKDGVKGLVSVIGVKYTTARTVAEKTVDLVFRAWGKKPPGSISSNIPIYGGDIERFEDFLEAEVKNQPCGLTEQAARRLVSNYGSAYTDVLRYLEPQAIGSERLYNQELAIARAEVRHGVREEIAQKLSDVILRRTDLGTAGPPGREVLRVCADTMGSELGWTPARTERELEEIHEIYHVKP